MKLLNRQVGLSGADFWIYICQKSTETLMFKVRTMDEGSQLHVELVGSADTHTSPRTAESECPLS